MIVDREECGVAKLARCVVAVLTLLLGGLSINSVAAQDCDRCVVNNYLQSAMLHEVSNHLGLQLDYDYRHTMLTGSSDTPNAADEKLANTLVNLYYSHNLFESINLDLNLPFVSQAYTARPDYTYDSGRESAFGDMSLLLTFQPFFGVKDDKLADWRLRAGVKLPTGDSSALGDFRGEGFAPSEVNSDYPVSALYPYDRAIGSGSTDWIVGSSYVVRYQEWLGLIDAQYIGRTTGENDFRFGDTVTAHVMPGYLFSQARGNQFSVLMDMAYRYGAQGEYRGDTVVDSGQTEFTIGPKLMAKFQKKIVASVGIDLPLYQSVEGTQLAADYQITAGVMTGF